jgi:hypothetical protein
MMSIKKEGLNRGNGTLLFGNLSYIAEAVMLYAAMTAIGHQPKHQLHVFHAWTTRANIFGTIADSSKAYSYFHNGEYLNAMMYVFLAAGNAVPLIPEETRRLAVRRLMRMAPRHIGKIKAIGRVTRPANMLLMGVAVPVLASVFETAKAHFFPNWGKKSGSSGSHH